MASVRLWEERQAMRDRLARTPACDGVALCRGLEGLYEQIAIRPHPS